MMYKYPLADNNFTFLDKLKICKFFLTNERWTQGKYVKEYEEKVADYVGCKYAVFTSSGSTANQLVCQQIKDDLIKNKEWPRKNKVIVGSVTWQTNVSIWVREGFEPIFVDINLDDFCFNYFKVENILKTRKDIACLFPTAVIGFTPNIKKLRYFEEKYKVKVMLDACENFFGEYDNRNICSYFTSTTSTFIAHHLNNGCEGGFIFTNNEEKYEYYLLARAHGLTRNIIPYKEKFTPKNYEESIGYSRFDSLSNPLVDQQFDFNVLSSNYRNTDIGAFLGLLDWKRIDYYKQQRIRLYEIYSTLLDNGKYYLPIERNNCLDIAFCLPIIRQDKKTNINLIKPILQENSIEVRGFISGNMLRQLPYQKYGSYKKFKNAEFINNNAAYCGLTPYLKEKDIVFICNVLNKI